MSVRSTKRTKGFTVIELMIIIAIFCILGSMPIISYFECHAKWDKAGMAAVEWGPMQGCMLKQPDGRWLPAERMREIEMPRPK